MKIIFMGTPEIATASLKILAGSKHEIAYVITQPDKVSGRGKELKYSPVKQAALELNLDIMQPERIADDEIVEQIKRINPDLLVVVAYAQKIPESLLNINYGCINIHPSLLPKYRGANPIRGPILNGDKVSGVTIMQMADKLDAGDILSQEVLELDEKETALTLEEKLSKLGAKMLLDVIEKIERNEITKIKQDDLQSTYLSQTSKQEGMINFNNSASYIERQIRALNPWPSAFTTFEGKTFKIWDADVLDNDEFCDEKNGSVVFADKKEIHVKCEIGILKINEVQLEGKKRMNIEEFLRGKKIERGFIFGE